MEQNIILVRGAQELIKEGWVSYGWDINFKEYKDGKDLIERGFKAQGKKFGRKRKQIEKFRDIKAGDIIVVPVNKAIVIGVATDEREYVKNPDIRYSSNRIKVDFYKKDSKVIYIKRAELDMRLEQRLKIRTSIASLLSFKAEISKIINKIENGEEYSWNTAFIEKEQKAKEDFIDKITKRMSTGKGLGIRAGGIGLETLIKEILCIKGYEAFIPAKNSKSVKNKHIADVDIVAFKNGEFDTKGELLLIQVKHHKGKTNDRGVKQLEEYKDYTFLGNEDFTEDEYTIKKILITTGQKVQNDNENIKIIDGNMFSVWLYENINLLSYKTKTLLGISEVPTLI